MDFFVYSRDAADSAALRGDGGLLEQHWSYMDGFAGSMIARGPTLATDRETPTGSLHVLGLPSVAAAVEFVEREPNNRAGVYAEHFVWRFANLLGRTMWEFGRAPDEPTYLIIARPQRGPKPVPLQAISADVRERLLLYGALSALDDDAETGAAVVMQAPQTETVHALLERGQLGLGVFGEIEIHDWEPGGRR